MTSLHPRTLFAGACVAASLAMAPALAAGPAPEATTATNPLGGKSSSPAKPAAGAKQITWVELVPPGWDPAKDFKDIDLGKLEDNDPRAAELLQKMQDVLNNAPTNAALNGVQVRLPGFVVPLEESKGLVSEFLLVPYFGACIHTPPPPANQILHVRPRTPVKFRAMDAVWVSGPLRTERNDSMMGASGYSMTAEAVTKYTESGK